MKDWFLFESDDPNYPTYKVTAVLEGGTEERLDVDNCGLSVSKDTVITSEILAQGTSYTFHLTYGGQSSIDFCFDEVTTQEEPQQELDP